MSVTNRHFTIDITSLIYYSRIRSQDLLQGGHFVVLVELLEQLVKVMLALHDPIQFLLVETDTMVGASILREGVRSDLFGTVASTNLLLSSTDFLLRVLALVE